MFDIYKFYGEKLRESNERRYNWNKDFYIKLFGKRKGLKLLAKLCYNLHQN